ncbi:hypothetical protein M3J07_009601 [Ascochyta lentis]
MNLFFPSFKRLENKNALFPEGRHYPYHGNTAPEKASRTPDESKTYYASFYEKAECVPHRDGRQIIVYWIPQKVCDPRETDAWAVNRLKRVHEMLSGNHPRIVRYNGVLDGIIGGDYNDRIGGLLVERLTPGPLSSLNLPTISAPISSSSPPEDKITLSLYYRWALQSLSAISYLHSHRIFLCVFSSQMVWLRPDFSIALTGFINAVTAPVDVDSLVFSRRSLAYTAEFPLEDAHYAGDERIHYIEDGEEVLGIKSDLFQLATFVWRLMTGSEQEKFGWPWEPSSPKWDDTTADYGQNYDTLDYAIDQRANEGLWQELEEERLGQVLIRAWDGGYESVEDVMMDVKTIAKKLRMSVIGDEIDIGYSWEDIFGVVQKEGMWEQELRIKGVDEWVEI